jgi:hypothetical protein
MIARISYGINMIARISYGINMIARISYGYLCLSEYKKDKIKS